MIESMERFRVAVIGAGWYGCHIAAELIRHGNSVTVFEKDSKVFQGSSGKNQFRLHLGFHYPRSHITRAQSSSGYNKFLEKYPHLFYNVTTNVYAVASEDSLLDWETYKTVMENDCKGSFSELDCNSVGLHNVEGALICQEGALIAQDPERYFQELLHDHLVLNHRVSEASPVFDEYGNEIGVNVDGEAFDWLIDCTYGQFKGVAGKEVTYEPCLTLIYKRLHRNKLNSCNAFTIMDGPFVSLFPYFQTYADAAGDLCRLHTLTHVTHTPLGHFDDFGDTEKFLECFSESDALERKPLFEDSLKKFYPRFDKEYKYHGFFLSCKTKLKSASDSRETVCSQNGRTITILSGKVNTIFDAENAVLGILNDSSKRK